MEQLGECTRKPLGTPKNAWGSFGDGDRGDDDGGRLDGDDGDEGGGGADEVVLEGIISRSRMYSGERWAVEGGGKRGKKKGRLW